MSLDLVNVALGLMVLQIVVLIGPGTTLGLIAQNKPLMGVHALSGLNRVIYWAFLAMITATGLLTLVMFLYQSGGVGCLYGKTRDVIDTP